MKASQAEADPSLLGEGVEVGVGGESRVGPSVGEPALLPVTHQAPLHDRQPCLTGAQWEVWGSTV